MSEPYQKTKIICTLGPASNTYEMVRQLAQAGMNVARLNFSYGHYREFSKLIRVIRQVESELGQPIGVMQDLQGPKIRLGAFASAVSFKAGDSVQFSWWGEKLKNALPIQIRKPRALLIGQNMILGDSGFVFKVEKIFSKGFFAVAESQGILKSYQGVHFPDTALDVQYPTYKDLKDFRFGCDHGMDFVALSFVQNADDVESFRKRIKGRRNSPEIISKIEQPESVRNLDEILKASDGVIVARGDLGLEMGLEEIPLLQKRIIEKAAFYGKYVITATQMLESMIEKETPTRAEVSDVANAVLDGTDAVLLSGETAAGKYPVKTVEAMKKILARVEDIKRSHFVIVGEGIPEKRGAYSLARSASEIAEKLKIDRIVPFTYSGISALRVSKFHPRVWTVAMTPQKSVWRKMSIYWGVYPILTRMVKSTDAMFNLAVRELLRRNLKGESDSILVVAGIPLRRSGITNLIKIHSLTES